MKLQISDFLATDWTDVTSYQGTSLQATVSVATDNLVANSIYRFRISSVNDYGSSDWSQTIALAVAPLPSAPLPPVKV
jgi:hypothetical protein